MIQRGMKYNNKKETLSKKIVRMHLYTVVVRMNIATKLICRKLYLLLP